MTKKVLITGGAGFIGSHLVRHFVNKYANYDVYNLDVLTYAGNLENLKDVDFKSNYNFLKSDITDALEIERLFKLHKFHSVIHLAAESHVDRSIKDPLSFAKTNILGTLNLLEAFKKHSDYKSGLFYHISTDEVYGSLGAKGLFTEKTSYDPNSPYSASKASSDHFVRAYGETYGLRYVISNCSNNYGSFQFPEKLIPLFINNIIHLKPLPVYGDGNYTRDWLFVKDHATAIDSVFHHGVNGETYNIGGHNEWKNIDLVKLLCAKMDMFLNRPNGESEKLITFVNDRPGHDLRYAIDASKIYDKLDWKPSLNFEEGLEYTIKWYLDNQEWLDHVTSGAYKSYYKKQYS
jgi:dTDP-glucose 4,6-dehydratase